MQAEPLMPMSGKHLLVWACAIVALTACAPRISDDHASQAALASGHPPPADKTPQQEEESGAYIARGNEPFWAIEVDGTTLLWKTPENQKGTQLRAERRITDTDAEFQGRDGGRAFKLLIQPTPCQDSMSGQAFEFTASWSYDGQTHSGCAQRKP